MNTSRLKFVCCFVSIQSFICLTSIFMSSPLCCKLWVDRLISECGRLLGWNENPISMDGLQSAPSSQEIGPSQTGKFAAHSGPERRLARPTAESTGCRVKRSLSSRIHHCTPQMFQDSTRRKVAHDCLPYCGVGNTTTGASAPTLVSCTPYDTNPSPIAL